MRRLTAAGAAIFAAVALSACGSSDDGGSTTSGGSGGGSGGGESIAYISPVGSQPGQQQVSFGLERAADTEGWTYRVVDANLSPDRQVSHVDTLINERISAFASWTLDPGAVAGAYTRANEAGIPVIGINSEGPGVTSTVWWEVNTCEPDGPWQRTAEFIAERRPRGKVIVMGGPPAPSITANVRCFRDAAEAAGLEIIDQADNVRDAAAPAAQLADDLLTKHGDVDAFWDYNDQTALGVSSAVLNAGKRVSDGRGEGIMVFGSNGDPDGIQAVREGRLTGTWDTDSVATGWAMALAMRDALGKAGETLPSRTVRSTMWTADNIADYVDPRDRDYSFDSIPFVEGGS
ncbi:sugar ABC transporter substrate-binding protein [Conexibacter woesei]|uniref:Periplasmic binding protein/LacI transcriptional regulator n=1 Tax=Conexibacter woesei (strain DSM 14684 / CCUG 47730 / CIP 108061 / JCM 11494 / NBRC 100937 / ID131577) TaxID=469383 RepID=D3F2N4_CONWI|nr:sugar ABC transporter substrate-binding protein [Conexibacter woesei]ADB52300.1 periplasmic binding protein/LacI transcriptional regulator [Conexibacter woesei DSM 14684]